MELSIVVPVYNVENYLRECLDSLYAIKGMKKEIILVNDGSTDRSLDIIMEYQSKHHNNTVVVDKKNGGLSSARNAGIRVAKGKYISFIDSDDFIDPVMFEKFYNEVLAEKLDVGVANLRYYQDGKSGSPLFRSDLIKDAGVVDGRKFLDLVMEKPKCFREEVVDDLYRREFLVENNLYFKEGILHEDTLFTPMVYLKAKRVKYLDYPFYNYRQRAGGIMSVVTQKSIDSLRVICEILLEQYRTLDTHEGRRALSKLIISLYKVVVYREYEKNGSYNQDYGIYRDLYRELDGGKNEIFNEELLNRSLRLSVLLRKLTGREIKNEQKIPGIK